VSPDHVIAAGNTLGEGVQWHADSGLWWTDIQRSELLHLAIGETTVRRFALTERLGSFARIVGSETLIGAFASGFALFDPTSGAVDWRHRVELPGSRRRLNDGRVDRQGRFWAGSMIEGKGSADAALYRIDHDGGLASVVGGLAISNGLCWSPDGRTMYHADSPRRTITAYDFDPDEGVPSAPRLFAETPPGAYPDGAAIDADGCLWSAQWGASRVVRYTPAGAIDRVIALPVSQPSCVAFAGADLNELTITTARDGLDASALTREPLAGDVLVYRVAVSGLPEMRMKPWPGEPEAWTNSAARAAGT